MMFSFATYFILGAILIYTIITVVMTWVICSAVKERENVRINVKLMNDEEFKTKYVNWLNNTYNKDYIDSLS